MLFGRLVSQENVTLVYVTGRHIDLIRDAMLSYDLPRPDYCLADVGSTIYKVNNAGWVQLDSWDKLIALDWQGKTHSELCYLLGGLPSLRLQEKEKQRSHKLSFYVPLDADIQGLVQNIKLLLQQAEIRANIIWSIDEEAKVGLLDVLPASANKLLAIRFLMQQNDIAEDNVVFAGDSGNDADVLLSGIPSVLVANAHEEVKKLVEHVPAHSLYLAQGGYLGMNGNYSAGILEGVAHFHPDLDVWLRSQLINVTEG